MPRKRAITAPPDIRPRYWPLRWHYACGCGWYARKEGFVEEPKYCPECGAEPK